jgi:hypothetical protein
MTAPLFTPVNEGVFGPMVSAADVEDHVQATLQRWFPTYLYQVERLHQLVPGTLPAPRAWVRSAAVEKFPEDQLPAVMIGSPGLTDDPPAADGAGYYTAAWRINLGLEIAAGPNRRALELARWYTLALRAAILQQQQDPGLPGPVQVARIDWITERYDLLDSIDDRTVCVGIVELVVTAAGVLQRNAGPLDPIIPPQPPDPNAPAWPVAATVDTTVTKEPL